MIKFLRSFGFAFNGIVSAFSDQRNTRVLIFIAIGVVAAGLYYEITSIEWCIVLLCIALVVGLEMINSSIEGLVDLVTLEKRPLAGKVKDIAAGAVLFASVLSAIIGLIIFGKYLMR
jgi:diacylglycerol kinase